MNSEEINKEIIDMTLFEKILHSKKLNYVTLSKLVNKFIGNKKIIRNDSNTINIFIDFYDIIKPFYNPKTIETFNNIKMNERFMISSEILNTAAHYRHFFYSRLRLFTNIIFFYSNKKDKYRTSIDNNYRKDFYDKRLNLNNQNFGVLNEIIQKNINLIKAYCEYIPHLYFINSGNIDYNLIPYIFLSKDLHFKQNIIDSNNNSIIITNEKYNYQDLLLNDNVLQLELRGKLKSNFITSEDIIKELVTKSKKEYSFTVLPELFPLILSLSGYKEYNINGINKMGYIKALNFIQKLLNKNCISNIQYKNIKNIKELSSYFKNDDFNIFYNNLKLLNNDFYKFNSNDLVNIQLQLIDKIDMKSVRYINDKYFTRYPILLNFLFDGEAKQ